MDPGSGVFCILNYGAKEKLQSKFAGGPSWDAYNLTVTVISIVRRKR